MAERGALERAHIRLALVRELAAGDQTRAQLARKYGVVASSITEFAQRHASRIAEVQSKLDDEFAGLWVAQKANRLATYQDQIEHVAALLEPQDEDEAAASDAEFSKPRAAGVNVSTAELMRTAQTALRAVAEELGQLPSRQTVQHEGGISVRYEIVNVDPGALT